MCTQEGVAIYDNFETLAPLKIYSLFCAKKGNCKKLLLMTPGQILVLTRTIIENLLFKFKFTLNISFKFI